MATLTVKDQNGNLIEIPALRGPKGPQGKRGADGAGAVPVGTIVSFASDETIPSGYLRCDGTYKVSNAYPLLKNIIKETYGAYGTTTLDSEIVETFKLPSASDVPNITNPVIKAFSGVKEDNAEIVVSNALSDINSKADNSYVDEELDKKVDIPGAIGWHNTYVRCKYLGDSITDAQNTAIRDRSYNDLFIGDYWTIGGINYRIAAVDYYYNCGDTNFDKGNIIVVPDTCLYNAQMNSTNVTTGAYYGSAMRNTNLNSAKTTIASAFGAHVANHRIVIANATDSNGVTGWAWYDSPGVELMNEVQVYGTRAWGSALKGFDVATQLEQLPLFAVEPQFIKIRQNYWLQDISSGAPSAYFAFVYLGGDAGNAVASDSSGVRPAITLSYI